MKTFDGLTVAQDRALGRIAIGLSPGCSQRTLDVLLERGLIEAEERIVGRDVLGVIAVIDYFVPLDVHMLWCSWCAENCPDKPDGAETRAMDATTSSQNSNADLSAPPHTGASHE